MNKNPIMRSILYTLSALLLLTGCTKELTEPGSRNDGKIRISFSTPMITDETTTPPATDGKAFQSSSRASITENTTVRVVAYLSGSMTYVADQTYYMNGGKLKPCTVNPDGTFKAVDMQNELALVPDKYDFYAITPALPLNADQKTVTVPNGVDYASSVTSNITVNSDQTLTLTQLSRKSAKIALEIKKADDNTDMTALKMNPSGNGVTISALPASQNITLNADIPAATGTTVLTIPASAFTLNGTTSKAITYLLPRLGTSRMSLSYDLTYTVSGIEESKTVSGSMGNTVLEKGKSYTFTLTMRKTGASLTVTDWIESNQEVVTGESLDYTDNGKPWFLTAVGDAKNPNIAATDQTKMNWYVATGTYHQTENPQSLKACPDGWRVPTRDEILLMWSFRNAVSNPQYLNYYWTSDSYSDTNAWVARMTDGYLIPSSSSGTDYTLKTALNNVRCIRYTSLPDKKYPYVDQDGKNIIIRDGVGGSNTGAIHASWSTTPSHSEQSTLNALSAGFEIAKEDCNSTNASGVANYKNEYYYDEASKACAAYSEGSNGLWHLPTQREISIVYFMYNKVGLGGINPILTTNDYWTGTYQVAGSNAWRISFATGRVTTAGNSTYLNVRCVRDVGLTVSSSILSADYAQWGNSFSKSIAFSSMNGSVSVKSIDNSSADKNWLVSAVVSGSTSGQVQITYKPTPGNAGVHNDVTITLVNQAGTTQTITVKYDNGFIPSSVLSANGWATNLPTNGVQIAKKGNKLPSATADANWDNELMQWTSVSSTNVPLAQEQGYGKGATNTTAIITALGADGVAASKCRSLGANWYLPTLNELIVIQTCQLYLGVSYAFNRTTNNFYWSSSEQATGTISAWRLPMYTIGGGSTNTKTEKNYVRAMMNL